MRISYLISFGISFLFSLFLSSCSVYTHFPLNQKVMDFTEEKQIIACVSESQNSISGYLGYSFNDHFGFTTGISTLGRHPYQKFTNNIYIDHELTFYQKMNQNLLVGMNFGFGYGKQETDEFGKINPHKQVIKPYLGYTREHFEFILSSQLLRANLLVDASDRRFMNNDELKYYFLEPALTIGLGIKESKLRIQYVGSFKLNAGQINYMARPTFNFSIHTRIKGIEK